MPPGPDFLEDDTTRSGPFGGPNLRRYLGNWMTESTADVYTREKRNVAVKVWKAVANGMDEICTLGRMVREDLNHPDWDGSPLLPEASPLKPMDRSLEFEEPLEDLEGVVVTPPKKETLPLVLEENPDGEIQETLEHQEDQPAGAQQPWLVKTLPNFMSDHESVGGPLPS